MRVLMWAQAVLFFVLLPVTVLVLTLAMTARQISEAWHDGWNVWDRDIP